MKCKVEENAIVGLSKAEMVRNACFYIQLVSVIYGLKISSGYLCRVGVRSFVFIQI